MKLILLQLLLAFLAATVLAAPTVKGKQEQGPLAKLQVIPERAVPPEQGNFRTPFVVKLPAETPKRIVDPTEEPAELTKKSSSYSSWISRLLFNKDRKIAGMMCFCAGGSVCCHGAFGGLNCNMGNCGL